MNDAATKPFGTIFAPLMTISQFDGSWSQSKTVSSDTLTLHPGAHVFHYASCCFEGLKAYKMPDGSVTVFRLDRHVARMQTTAKALSLPVPPAELIEQLILEALDSQREYMPDTPAAMYIRPTLIGTEPAIGKAAAPSSTATLFVLLSIVGDYFSSGSSGLVLLMEDRYGRTAKGMGAAKAGANYASALHLIVESRQRYPEIAQVLFSPNGQVQETGASNFFLINDEEVVTGSLDDSFLAGVTRDSLITLAKSLGYTVRETNISPQDVIDWSNAGGEAALSGTAAVLSPVQTIIFHDDRYEFAVNPKLSNTSRLRSALQDIQFGTANDPHLWRRQV